MRLVVLQHFVRADLLVDLHLRANPFAGNDPLIERPPHVGQRRAQPRQLALQIALVVDLQLLHQRRQLVLFERLTQVLLDPRQILRRHVAAELVVQQLAIHHRGNLALHQLLPHALELLRGHLVIRPAFFWCISSIWFTRHSTSHASTIWLSIRAITWQPSRFAVSAAVSVVPVGAAALHRRDIRRRRRIEQLFGTQQRARYTLPMTVSATKINSCCTTQHDANAPRRTDNPARRKLEACTDRLVRLTNATKKRRILGRALFRPQERFHVRKYRGRVAQLRPPAADTHY